MRWGLSPCLRHTRATIMWLTSRWAASLRVVQWVEPLGAWRVLSRIRASSSGVSTVATWPMWRLYSPAIRCCANRRLQLATKPRLHSIRSEASSHVWHSPLDGHFRQLNGPCGAPVFSVELMREKTAEVLKLVDG